MAVILRMATPWQSFNGIPVTRPWDTYIELDEEDVEVGNLYFLDPLEARSVQEGLRVLLVNGGDVLTVMGLWTQEIRSIRASELRRCDFLSVPRRNEFRGGSRTARVGRGLTFHPQCRDEYNLWPMVIDDDGDDANDEAED